MASAVDTRARILEVASELFTDQGYDATSLREIADRLGFTKAALYYHFKSKDEIMLALLEPADELISQLHERLGRAENLEGWADALEWIIGELFAHLDFFKLMERNRATVEVLFQEMNALSDHHLMHERVEASVRSVSDDRAEQIRMVAAIGAVTGFDDWAPGLLTELPPEQILAELTATVRDILRLPRRRAARPKVALRPVG
jgi:AcrR family transcriptional regulator